MKKKHIFLKIIAVIAILILAAALFILSHPQIIVGAIQSLTASQINTGNYFEPLGEPISAER